jgi:hypothetical protein
MPKKKKSVTSTGGLCSGPVDGVWLSRRQLSALTYFREELVLEIAAAAANLDRRTRAHVLLLIRATSGRNEVAGS